MKHKIIANKSTIYNGNGELCYDLLSKSFNDKLEKYGTVIIVNKYYVARPDLISLAIYNDDSYADIICKLNGISNPFEINENDYLFIPALEYIRDSILYPTNSKNDFISGDDDEIVKKQSNYQKKLKEKRSPNEQIVGEKSYVIDKSLGVVFY